MTTPSFNELIEQDLKNIVLKPGNVVKAMVTNISSDYITVDAGLKSEADIPTAEFTQAGKITVAEGDEVDVLIEQIEIGDGVTYLSREKAHKASVWAKLEKAKDTGEVIIGAVTDRVKGGFTVDVDSLRAFLPGSQADIRQAKEGDDFDREPAEFKIINMDKKRNNIVVSRRAVLEKAMAADSSALLEKLSEGAQIKGIVKNLTDYGAFVDLGGLDGLLHITDISWKRVKHPSEVLEVGQELDVKVLSFDKEKNRVALGLKQLCSDPWHGVAERYKVKSRIFGEVTNITDYGCFVEIENGIEGLVHMSEMDWTNRNIRPNKIVNVGDEVEVMIIDVDESKRRISLGIKQCIQNPWVEFADNHELGNVVSGNIKSITDFGIFVGLEGGIDGLVHLTDISWKSNGEEAIRDFKRNDEITAKILSIDPERERISLSIREMSADPYLDFFASHDAEVTGTVTAVDSKRVTLELAENVFGSIKEIEFKSKGLPEVGAEVTAFIVSHERKNQFVNLTLEQTDTVAKTEVKRSKPSAPHKSPTLGDLIKDKMSGSE